MPATYPALEYFDGNGRVWSLHLDTLALRPIAVSSAYRVWPTTNCSGPAYYTMNNDGPVISPRLTFTAQGHPETRVRNDDAQVVQIAICSSDGGGTCEVTQPCPWNHRAVLESQTTVVTAPVVAAVRPLRPVFVAP